MIRTAWCPRSWKSRILRRTTAWPTWRSFEVGSAPSFTRSFFPVLSFARSASGVFTSAPRVIASNASVMGEILREAEPLEEGADLVGADRQALEVGDLAVAVPVRPGAPDEVELPREGLEVELVGAAPD